MIKVHFATLNLLLLCFKAHGANLITPTNSNPQPFLNVTQVTIDKASHKLHIVCDPFFKDPAEKIVFQQEHQRFNTVLTALWFLKDGSTQKQCIYEDHGMPTLSSDLLPEIQQNQEATVLSFSYTQQ